ncbi:hypothetical protein GCM10023319_19950 [Nocardia iowensis]
MPGSSADFGQVSTSRWSKGENAHRIPSTENAHTLKARRWFRDSNSVCGHSVAAGLIAWVRCRYVTWDATTSYYPTHLAT